MRPGVVHGHGFNWMSDDRLEDNDRCGPVSFDWTKLTETFP